MSKILIQNLEISEDEFAKLAEQQGYERKYEYPLVMENRKNGDVWEFSGLFSGICLVAGDEGSYVGEKCDNLVEHTNSLWKPCERPTKLYDGLTEAQWEQVVADKLLVQVTDTCNDFGEFSELLHSFNKEGQYNFCADGVEWKHCRIHPSQPQFGGRAEWIKASDLVVVKYKSGDKYFGVSAKVNWENVDRWQVVKL